MPIHSVGYRSWDGRLVPEATRWGMIASTGIRRTARSKWLRRMMFFAILPTVLMAIPFFVFEQALRDPDAARELSRMIRGMPQGRIFLDTIPRGLAFASPEQIELLRHKVWSYLLLTLFRYPQAVLMVLVIGIVAPPLISQDVRSRAFMVYFSRPIVRAEYVLGKFGTVAFFLLMITTFPALVLYAFGVLLSPSLTVVGSTWDLPLLILLASAVLILPTTSISLMFSSLTRETRYAGFAWFAVWILGWVMFNVMMALAGAVAGDFIEPGWRVLLSPYHTLGVVQSWVFGLQTDDAVVGRALTLLVAATIVPLTIVYRRVGAPLRA
ncbi:MAG: ABC transporter permease subunit [Planctomycetaceae bacterium]|nr:ABC transporter permease subunit [Planctomycetaceae bacterium]